MNRLTPQLVFTAIDLAVRNHYGKPETEYFLKDRVENGNRIYRHLVKREFPEVKYTYRVIESVSGKKRILAISKLEDRVYMYVAMLLMGSDYLNRLSDDCYNCIPQRGINSSCHRYDPNRQLKRMFLSGAWGFLQLDISKCYETTDSRILAAEHARIWKDKDFLRLLGALSTCDIGLPVGSPISPVNHHIMMMRIDRFVRQELKIKNYVRYADDMILLGDKDQLLEARWRLENKLFYELGYTLKKRSKPTPLRVGADILGYVYKPGVTRIRKTTKQRIKNRWNKPASKASYLGIIKGADAANLKATLDMKLSFLATKESKVTRRMDSPLIDIAELEGKVFDILDYEVREPDKKNGRMWMRMQVRYQDNGETLTRLVKGYQEPICQFLQNMVKYMRKTAAISGMSYEEVRKATLPIEECEVENDKGWVLKGTLNKIE